MPTSLISAFLFIVLLFPGYVYERRRERDTIERLRSPLREVVSIVFVGVVTDLVALLILVGASTIRLSVRLNVADLIENPARYLAVNYMAAFWWVISTLIVASALAYAAAARPWSELLSRRSAGYRRQSLVSDPQQSAWWLLLYQAHRRMGKHIECFLDDGSRVSGMLYSLSRSSAETADRDLALLATRDRPITVQPNGATDTLQLRHGAVIISARRMVMLRVSYTPRSSDGVQASAEDSRGSPSGT
jgi:Family of unknown function (DUF6338)